ncbi:TetR/AcrR family transcriptional regulator [Paenibacillus sp. NFR01]|uniref:TetR/AcrR family transcriptional regulator n=1 Tax=Paenibacillus sp. NFR01 TaxID=1566279 RepID=UPI0008AD1C12|nr:TetR/AcrR family transcriptional regulator [Paenibacillus sp. NFR01]SET17032.1 transcriptional regulator, TetR family [Paenibacillus sp. NFR01]
METAKRSSKEIILETAAQLFAIQGYHGTGLNQIIRESGAPKGSLYYYFPDGKEELAIACVHLIRERLLEKLMYQITRHPKPVDFMQAFVLEMADSMDASGTGNFIPIGFWAAAETSTVSDVLREACQTAFAEWKSLIAGKLNESGVSLTTAEKMAELSVCLIEGATILTVVERNSRAMRRAAEHIPMILNHGLPTE